MSMTCDGGGDGTSLFAVNLFYGVPGNGTDGVCNSDVMSIVTSSLQVIL